MLTQILVWLFLKDFDFDTIIDFLPQVCSVCFLNPISDKDLHSELFFIFVFSRCIRSGYSLVINWSIKFFKFLSMGTNTDQIYTIFHYEGFV